ncbi:MAG: 6,7-dimethyl-8-ribityllumazine synthase [Planctomycetota bacterium]
MPDPSHQSNAGTGALPAVAIVISRYNETVTDALLQGAIDLYLRRGGSRERLTIIQAPGAFELPVMAAAPAGSGRFGAVVALGCLIHGETRHDRYIASAVADGLTRISIETRVPCAFGVITAETSDHARARSGGEKGNKGAEAMAAALDAACVLRACGGDPEPGKSYAASVGPAPDKTEDQTGERA